MSRGYLLIGQNYMIPRSKSANVFFPAIVLLAVVALLVSLILLASACSQNQTNVRVESLKGPTSVGLAGMMNDDSKNSNYEFTMVAQPDAVVADLAAKKVDIALMPANLAVNYYNKSDGEIKLIDINTLGAMYVLSTDGSLSSMSDIKGKTLYMAGKGSVPQAVFASLMQAAGLSTSDVDIQYKSEASEVIASTLQKPGSVGLVNEPQATLACERNSALKCVIDLQNEWRQLMHGEIITGVTVVRSEYLNSHEAEVKKFLSDHGSSVKYAKENPSSAVSVLNLDDLGNSDVAAKAVDRCNICCIYGAQAKDTLQPFLQAIYESSSALFAGGLPDDNFYLNVS